MVLHFFFFLVFGDDAGWDLFYADKSIVSISYFKNFLNWELKIYLVIIRSFHWICENVALNRLWARGLKRA